MPHTISIKQLHAATGRIVRAVGRSGTPTAITDRGLPTALLVPLSAHKLAARSPRRTTPEYEDLMRGGQGAPVADDLDAVRGNR